MLKKNSCATYTSRVYSSECFKHMSIVHSYPKSSISYTFHPQMELAYLHM